MSQVTITLKIKFSNLNHAKTKMFGDMTEENTILANWLLIIPLPQRRKLTTAKVETSLMSALANQTIRHTTSGAGKKVKQYKSLPPEINKQNWSIHKMGETYSLSFPAIKGTKRVPIEVASKHWQPILDRLLNGDALIDKGSAKLIKHRNRWYAYVSVTLEAYYSLEQKLEYKLAFKGLRLIKRPAPYTSKSCSTCGTLGTRKKHDFNCPLGHYHNADLNAARNLAQWDGFSCSLDLKKDAAVMVSSGLEDGLLGTTPNLMKGILPRGEYL